MKSSNWLGLWLAAGVIVACGGNTGTGTNESDLTGSGVAKADAGPASCAEAACGPKPLGAEVLCEDGSTAGVTGRCLATDAGQCGWEITECPASPTLLPCADEAACGPKPL